MINQFKEHIAVNFPELLENHFLVACSGGVDSVVLAHLCSLNKMDFSIVHCNFQLRGYESDMDAFFVEDLARKLGKKIYIKDFDTDSYVNINKVSLQMAARELRYRWFEELMKKNKIKTLVTAHHVDDNLETFIINLSRGTGIKGLTGIPAKTSNISRPLLIFSRAQIMQFAEIKNISWREDHSNLDKKYLRNKIREDVIPRLRELHPGFLGNYEATRANLEGSAALLENYLAEIKQELFQQEDDLIRIPINSLLKLDPIKVYMYELFHQYGFKEWNDVVGLLTATSGKEIYSQTHRLLKDRQYLLLQPLHPSTVEKFKIDAVSGTITKPINMKIDEVKAMGEQSKRILYVDKETLNHKLSIRKWEKGDYFYPFGMNGTKKVSKFYKDEKLDLISKEKQWLLCSGDAIVWIIGRRGDDRFKVTPKTKNILRFTITE
ncbi:tRNA lysidine(34) synthetase TilS [uncultured Eudoraea sp.]|uniref:tRNA lysidine(34) synthetase TilS n=1 Tax=uncultured Eudoraea sp. TaxID=1035614 RepID=UPI00260CA967|nr:tRNA lysidine(34) synthetase TilS [uncultured Eudoraea sp.]